ncbi:hypothetical protein OIO90_000217 [Microbotryomycetes sp. JL221]|nr:hypothetical protein OIO90_000217 [Microbotryomycetes sp. JL221]
MDVYRNQLSWDDDDTELMNDSRNSKRAKHDLTAFDDDLDDSTEQLDTRLHGFHPPPTQDMTRFSQNVDAMRSTSHTDLSRFAPTASSSRLWPSQLINHNLLLQTDETSDSIMSIGPPPRFAWDPKHLTRFDQLRRVLRDNKTRFKPAVSFLAAVIDVREARSVGQGRRVGEWDLMDPTGQVVKMNIWGSGADDVTDLVKRGDVVFVDHAKLSEYNDTLQVSVNHERGEQLKNWGLQIVWRSQVRDIEDYHHRFDDRLRGQGFAAVDAVLNVVDWWHKWQVLPASVRILSTRVATMPPKKRTVVKKDDDAASDHTSQASASSAAKPTKQGLEADSAPPPAKKQKKQKEPVTPIDKSLPTNKQLPDVLTPIPKKRDGTVRVSAWNVCGVKSCENKGLIKYLEAEDADIVILTETKSEDPKFKWIDEHYPHRYWGVDGKKGYAGTAILSKLEPMSVTMGLPTSKDGQNATEGRIITLEFENSYVVGTYVPNAGEALKNMDRKVAWNEAFEGKPATKYLRQLDAKKPVIWSGDLNVIPSEIDIRNWKTNHNKSPGVTDTEIDAFNAQLNPAEDSGHKKLVDVWRHLNPELEGHYSYFSRRFDCRTKGIGWRLDFAVVSERVLKKVKACEIRYEIYGPSDHLPIVLDIEGPL